MYPFADRELAHRLESLAAEEMRRFVRTAKALDKRAEADIIEVGGGVAAYFGAGSPVNQAVGIGLDRAIDEADVDAIERFFGERSQRGLVALSPLADGSVVRLLGKRGWHVDGFENVLVRPFSDPLPAVTSANPRIRVVVVEDDEEQRDLWAHVAAVGFSSPLDPLPEQLALGTIVANRPNSLLLLALVDGLPAGTGEVICDGGVAWLSADSTLPQFRRLGVQSALQAERLRIGEEAGCDLAVSEAAPGSTSQRNMERWGFRVAYTRVDLVSPVLEHRPHTDTARRRDPEA